VGKFGLFTLEASVTAQQKQVFLERKVTA